MAHIIPLSVGQRRLDTGNVAQYPEGSPVGRAMQGFGDELSAVAEHYRQMKDRQEAFDAELARRGFNDQVVQAEDEAAARAPADGSGLHDAMYGQVDPRTGRVVKAGLFDTLFDNALPNMPESQRANFARQKEALRAAGSLRMAQRQLQRRDDYELAEWTKVDNMSTSAIAQSNPNDTANFEAIRQSGFDLIAKIGNPLARQAAEAAWRTNTAKALVQAMIAQDPKRAAEMLGAVQAGGWGEDGTAGAIGGSSASSGSNAGAAKRDRVGKLTPDERVAQAFKDDVPFEERPTLAAQARAADAAQQLAARSNIGLAELNAPAEIRKTGKYSGPTPTEEQFVALYGATEGGRRFEAFSKTREINRLFHDMLTMSNDAVRAMVTNSEPKTDSVTPAEDKARLDAISAAAQLTLKARQRDPGGYVRDAFATLDAAWSNLSKPEDYRAAMIGSIAAQQQLGFETIQPLPNSVAGSVVGQVKQETQPQDQDQKLNNIFAVLPTQAARDATLGHLLRTSATQATESATNRSRREAIVDPLMLLDPTKAVGLKGFGANAEATKRFLTAREKVGRAIVGDTGPGSLRRRLARTFIGSEGAGNEDISVVDFIPLLGAAFALDDATNAALDGNYREALLDALGVIPGEKLLSPAIKRGGRTAEPWLKSLSASLKWSDDLPEGTEALVRGVDAETYQFQQTLARSPSKFPRRKTPYGEISDSAFDTASMAETLARDPSSIKHPGAKVGWTSSKDYRKTFFSAHPHLNANDYVVHHRAEQQVRTRYPGLFADEELNSFENLIGIRKEYDINLHQKVIRYEWDKFYKTHPTATRQQVLDYAADIDKKYGYLFDPPIGEK